MSRCRALLLWDAFAYGSPASDETSPQTSSPQAEEDEFDESASLRGVSVCNAFHRLLEADAGRLWPAGVGFLHCPFDGRSGGSHHKELWRSRETNKLLRSAGLKPEPLLSTWDAAETFEELRATVAALSGKTSKPTAKTQRDLSPSKIFMDSLTLLLASQQNEQRDEKCKRFMVYVATPRPTDARETRAFFHAEAHESLTEKTLEFGKKLSELLRKMLETRSSSSASWTGEATARVGRLTWIDTTSLIPNALLQPPDEEKDAFDFERVLWSAMGGGDRLRLLPVERILMAPRCGLPATVPPRPDALLATSRIRFRNSKDEIVEFASTTCSLIPSADASTSVQTISPRRFVSATDGTLRAAAKWLVVARDDEVRSLFCACLEGKAEGVRGLRCDVRLESAAEIECVLIPLSISAATLHDCRAERFVDLLAHRDPREFVEPRKPRTNRIMDRVALWTRPASLLDEISTETASELTEWMNRTGRVPVSDADRASFSSALETIRSGDSPGLGGGASSSTESLQPAAAEGEEEEEEDEDETDPPSSASQASRFQQLLRRAEAYREEEREDFLRVVEETLLRLREEFTSSASRRRRETRRLRTSLVTRAFQSGATRPEVWRASLLLLVRLRDETESKWSSEDVRRFKSHLGKLSFRAMTRRREMTRGEPEDAESASLRSFLESLAREHCEAWPKLVESVVQFQSAHFPTRPSARRASHPHEDASSASSASSSFRFPLPLAAAPPPPPMKRARTATSHASGGEPSTELERLLGVQPENRVRLNHFSRALANPVSSFPSMRVRRRDDASSLAAAPRRVALNSQTTVATTEPRVVEATPLRHQQRASSASRFLVEETPLRGAGTRASPRGRVVMPTPDRRAVRETPEATWVIPPVPSSARREEAAAVKPVPRSGAKRAKPSFGDLDEFEFTA